MWTDCYLIALLLARKSRPKSLSKEVILKEIINAMEVEQFISKRKGKQKLFHKEWERFQSLKKWTF
jgi:hypothetical protein